MLTTAAVPASAAAPVLDAERLDCYRVALEFQVLASALLPKGRPTLRDQLERASVSVVLNLSEGAGRRARRDKRHFYSIAKGSAMESAAILDLLALRGLGPADECRRGRALLVRVVQMLTRLEQRMG